MQPGLKILNSGQFGAVEPDTEENILRDIFCLSGIFYVRANMGKYLQPVLVEQLGKGFRIVFSNTDQQFPGVICDVCRQLLQTKIKKSLADKKVW